MAACRARNGSVPVYRAHAGRTDGTMTTQTCPRCGADLYRRHCKFVCEQCGVVRDCSDPF